MKRIGLTASEEISFENVDRQTDDGYLYISSPMSLRLRSGELIIYPEKKASRFSISPVKWTSKPESRQCNEKANNLHPKSGDLAGLAKVVISFLLTPARVQTSLQTRKPTLYHFAIKVGLDRKAVTIVYYTK